MININNISFSRIMAILLIIIASLVISMLSFYIHFPEQPPIFDNWGFSYNDIVYGLFNPIFSDIVTHDGIIKSGDIPRRWFNYEMATKLVSGTKTIPIPYIDYKFEYPPLIGAIWLFSTYLAIQFSLPDKYTSIEYAKLIKKGAEIHYYIHSLILITAFIVTIIYMYRITKKLNISWPRILAFILLPSTVLYLIYNWDILATTFMVISIYYLLNKKYLISGLMLGLSISSKLLPLIFALVIIYDMIQKARKGGISIHHLGLFSSGIFIGGIVPYIFVSIVAYNGFIYFIEHHFAWYCENCIYSIIVQDIWSPYNRLYAMIFIPLFTLIMLTIDINYDYGSQLLNIALASIIISTSLNYVFSPQMMLMITAIGVLTLIPKYLMLLVIADIANFGIMAMFFKSNEISLWLATNLGIKNLKPDPHVSGSPVQIAAMVRNILLIIIMIYSIYKAYKYRALNIQMEHTINGS